MDNKEALSKDYLKLKTIYRQMVMMTIAILDGEEHYYLVKTTLPAIKQALEIMKKKIEEG